MKEGGSVEFWMIVLIKKQIERLAKEMEALQLGVAGLKRAGRQDKQQKENGDGTGK